MTGISWQAEEVLAFQEELDSAELGSYSHMDRQTESVTWFC
jgi:hypothetical protein